MTIGELCAHLARGVLQVESYLAAPLPDAPSIVDAVVYYARLEGTAEPESALNLGVRARSTETAGLGPDALRKNTERALTNLRQAFAIAGNPLIAITIHPGEAMLLDEYLRTRCVELTVHSEDLALSLGLTARPTAAASVAVDVLLGAARDRWGDVAVLRALTRRERDDVAALRVL
jgi:hypothetical protein